MRIGPLGAVELVVANAEFLCSAMKSLRFISLWRE